MYDHEYTPPKNDPLGPCIICNDDRWKALVARHNQLRAMGLPGLITLAETRE